jgi:hypothetical protein
MPKKMVTLGIPFQSMLVATAPVACMAMWWRLSCSIFNLEAGDWCIPHFRRKKKTNKWVWSGFQWAKPCHFSPDAAAFFIRLGTASVESLHGKAQNVMHLWRPPMSPMKDLSQLLVSF